MSTPGLPWNQFALALKPDSFIAHLKSGQRDKAIRQYLICREKLRHELQVEPGLHTRELYQHILAG